MEENKKVNKNLQVAFEVEATENPFENSSLTPESITEEELAYALRAIQAKREAEKPNTYEYTEVNIGKGKKALKFKTGKTQRSLLNKVSSPMWKLEERFIEEQKGRNNSSYTISYYERVFKKLYEALALMYEEGNEDFINDLYDSCPSDVKSPLAYVGKMFPIVVLEDLDLQANLTTYLKEVVEANDKTVESYLRGLKAIIKYAAENKWIEERKIVINEASAELKQVYTDEEIKRLVRSPSEKDFTEYRDWVIINHLLATGNRVQTIINIKIKDIDFEDGYLFVQKQKSGKTDRIPLPKKYLKILKEYIEMWLVDDNGEIDEDLYLFPNRYGEQFSPNGLKKAIALYNKSRGVEKTSIHLFRHTFAKNWIIQNGDIVSLQKILGHNTLKMVQHYSNLYSADIAPKVESFALINKGKKTSGKTLKTIKRKN